MNSLTYWPARKPGAGTGHCSSRPGLRSRLRRGWPVPEAATSRLTGCGAGYVEIHWFRIRPARKIGSGSDPQKRLIRIRLSKNRNRIRSSRKIGSGSGLMTFSLNIKCFLQFCLLLYCNFGQYIYTYIKGKGQNWRNVVSRFHNQPK